MNRPLKGMTPKAVSKVLQTPKSSISNSLPFWVWLPKLSLQPSIRLYLKPSLKPLPKLILGFI